MKKKIFLLYSVTLIVGVALIFGINAYTTDTYRFSSDTDITVPVEQVPTEITTFASHRPHPLRLRSAYRDNHNQSEKETVFLLCRAYKLGLKKS